MAKDDVAALKARIAELEANATKRTSISFKVSEKGAVSVYGMGRFPVTLYKEQWRKLNDAMPQLLDFVTEHEDELKSKGD